jgi:hypothetical protein
MSKVIGSGTSSEKTKLGTAESVEAMAKELLVHAGTRLKNARESGELLAIADIAELTGIIDRLSIMLDRLAASKHREKVANYRFAPLADVEIS